MGTRFIASHEARANEGYKKRITEITLGGHGDHALLLGQADARGPQRAGWTNGSAGPTRSRRFPEQMSFAAREGVLLFATAEADELRGRRARACRAARAPAGSRDIPTCAEIIDRVMSDASATIARLSALA